MGGRWYTVSNIPGRLISLVRLESEASFAQRAYAAVRAAILEMNIYESAAQDLRLDEREKRT